MVFTAQSAPENEENGSRPCLNGSWVPLPHCTEPRRWGSCRHDAPGAGVDGAWGYGNLLKLFQQQLQLTPCVIPTADSKSAKNTHRNKHIRRKFHLVIKKGYHASLCPLTCQPCFLNDLYTLDPALFQPQSSIGLGFDRCTPQLLSFFNPNTSSHRNEWRPGESSSMHW